MTESAKRRGRLRLRPQHAVGALLLAWSLGLGYATWRLQGWQQELSQVLVQLRADSLLRASVVRDRDDVQPEWYRRRALALLSAIEHMRQDASWTLVMPGSWSAFDDLEERASARVGEAFSEMVVGTIRRELDKRAAKLAGAAQKPRTAEVDVSRGCAPRLRQPAPLANPGERFEQLPEFQAASTLLDEATQLDRAVSVLTSLRQSDGARPEDLRMLIRYTLNAELSGPASRSIALFGAPSGQAEVQALARRVRAALDCSISRSADAVLTRWLGNHELLLAEDSLLRFPPATLFSPAGPSGLATSVARLRTVASLIGREEALLQSGDNHWMRSDSPQLGPAWQGLIGRVNDMQLLGTDSATRLQEQARARHAQFRRRFDAYFARSDAGVVWSARLGRFTLSPQRLALRDGIAQLLQAPFMADDAAASVRSAAYSPGGGQELDELLALVDQRRSFLREDLPVFPPALRPAVTRFVEDRIAQRAFERAEAFVASGVVSVDDAQSRISQVESTLTAAGSAAMATSLKARLDREVLGVVAGTEAGLRSLALLDPRSSDFSWWQGEPAPLELALRAPDDGALRRVVPDLAMQLEAIGRQFGQWGGPDQVPGLARWTRLRDEVERYRQGQADSSLLALERYLTAVGSQLRADNCAELLASQPAPRESDEIGLRHAQIHRALSARCVQLREAR